ncbi:MAG: PH domain-containing protein [Candidatus Cryptobacteroides sp.]|jgi:uncharacterized membrane protein YdbT with pleckstrin-like domain|nr:PH domain-containing protein [Candidatus Cryptobacteroides sp.]
MKIRADYRQFVAEDAGLIAIMAVLTGAVPVIIRDYDRMMGIAMGSLAAFILIFLVLRYVMLVNVKWLVEEETLCRIKGIFSKQTDYIEMYRITDYKENQSFLQRIMGVKTVTVYSTDRSDEVTDIPGVPADMNLIGIIRDNVEKCRKEKRIYEIANH